MPLAKLAAKAHATLVNMNISAILRRNARRALLAFIRRFQESLSAKNARKAIMWKVRKIGIVNPAEAGVTAHKILLPAFRLARLVPWGTSR